MQVIAQGRMVGYDRAGKGKSVIILHGWGAHRLTMHPISTELAKRFDVVTVDLPGFGSSERPDTGWTLADYSDWLEEFTGKIGIEHIYAVVGHSNGGAIAIKAISSGLKAQKLVLLGASGVRNREKGKQFFLRSAAKAGKVATKVLPKKAQETIRSKWYKKIGSELYEQPEMKETFKKIVSEDLLVDAAMITIPTLLLYGSEDTATPPLYGRLYHSVIENSELHIVDAAGHYSFIDAPNVVMDHIRKFLT